MIFIGQGRQSVTNKTPSGKLSAQGDTDHEAETETADGFSFFKKVQDYEGGDLDDNPALVAIEQEMLAVRSLYTGGRIIKDVYVSETAVFMLRHRRSKIANLNNRPIAVFAM